MAFIQYLTFDGTALPLPDSYEVQMDDVEADSGGETEAGTVQRDVACAGVVSIPVTFSVSAKWLKILTEFKQQEKITVGYFDTETLAVKTAEMYVEGYKASLLKGYIPERSVDGEFYAEGILNVYSFLREIVVYLRKTN